MPRTRPPQRLGSTPRFHRVKELNDILSDYVEESELNRLCRSTSERRSGSAVNSSTSSNGSEFWRRESDGAFDVTAGPIIRLWRQARRTKRLPSPNRSPTQRRSLAATSSRSIARPARPSLNRRNANRSRRHRQRLRRRRDAQESSPSTASNVRWSCLGGDVVLGDPPPNAKGWTVAIADLVKDRETFSVAAMRAAACRTAPLPLLATPRNSAVIDGKRYSHIVDPRTGQAQIGRRQTTIVAKTGIDADALATAAVMLGPERGGQVADKHGAAALFLSIDDGQANRSRDEAVERTEEGGVGGEGSG